MSKAQAMTQKTRYVIDNNRLQMETFKDLFYNHFIALVYYRLN